MGEIVPGSSREKPILETQCLSPRNTNPSQGILTILGSTNGFLVSWKMRKWFWVCWHSFKDAINHRSLKPFSNTGALRPYYALTTISPTGLRLSISTHRDMHSLWTYHIARHERQTSSVCMGILQRTGSTGSKIIEQKWWEFVLFLVVFDPQQGHDINRYGLDNCGFIQCQLNVWLDQLPLHGLSCQN